MVNTLRFDTGLQVHGVAGPIEWTGAVTQGSLSDPRVTDNNGRPQLAGRVQVRVWPSLRLGTSVASGPWLDDSLDEDSAVRVRRGASANRPSPSMPRSRTGAGWPAASGFAPRGSFPPCRPLRNAGGALVDPRVGYRLAPGLSLAARGDVLSFSEVPTASGPRPWEARVRRVETALSASVTRNITARLAWQHNWRDGGLVRRESVLAGQLLYWF